MTFKGKKVLLFGLGILGGGVAAANWLMRQGARVTVTDLKTRNQLADSIARVTGTAVWKLGGHSFEDVDACDIVVVNPDVPIASEYIQYAFTQGKMVLNEAAIFFEEFARPIVAVTGTRGKTTTTAWTEYFVSSQFASSIAGNSSTHPFLNVLDRASSLAAAVVELPSFHLELLDRIRIQPEVAVITNLSRDHLNRHKTMEEYAAVKANIFRFQTAIQHLVLNVDNSWTDFFAGLKPASRVWYFSLRPLADGREGVWHDRDAVYFKSAGSVSKVLSLDDITLALGEHNLANLCAAALAAHCLGVSWENIQTRLNSLPKIPFRQETVFATDRLMIINDTTATSPEGAIQAIKRFGSRNAIFIAGGTDRDLEYSEWARAVCEYIKPGNLIMLEGSATDKMRATLGSWADPVPLYSTLAECFSAALKKAGAYSKSVIVFSPGAKSFEKFKNEYDRGEAFNTLVRDLKDKQ
ncbi:MAG TPA: UDP-N-acetylmuramoyl-L-alanine--D-glutamate ligase [Candidatus Paceibacterota bacterium]|nr:UDP-N-acetylmuramoyl-L-alanine--D-glutamate ligase [Candidatus Paceibacterota bacterium]